MKFPTYKEMGEKVAKEAMDTFEYNGKTLREWIEIIASNDGDTISRKALINKFEQWQKQDGYDNEEWNLLVDVINEIKNMPPATDINVATKDGMDCISRKAAINAIDECYCGGEDSCGEPWIYQENAVEAIQMIEPILPSEPHWISCSERLPVEEKDVLVTVHFLGLKQTYPNGWNEHIKESYYVEVASHINGEWSSASDEYKIAPKRHKVIAWCELPEPYKGVTE